MSLSPGFVRIPAREWVGFFGNALARVPQEFHADDHGRGQGCPG